MAQVAKAVQMQVPSAVSGGRPPSGAANVASFGSAPIDELNPKLGTSLDDGSFLLHDFGRGRSPGNKEQSHHQAVGMLRATSQAFAAFLEFEGVNDQTAGAGVDGRSQGFSGLVSRAINAYETNARVVNGTEKRLGTSLSVNL